MSIVSFDYISDYILLGEQSFELLLRKQFRAKGVRSDIKQSSDQKWEKYPAEITLRRQEHEEIQKKKISIFLKDMEIIGQT